jgi:hypothetical protein
LDRSEMQRLAEADFLIGDAERAVACQISEIERLRVVGNDTSAAEKLLRAFRRTLKALQEHRQMIIKSIGLN